MLRILRQVIFKMTLPRVKSVENDLGLIASRMCQCRREFRWRAARAGQISQRRNQKVLFLAIAAPRMWARSKEWLTGPGGPDIPDLDSLHADACGPGYSYDKSQRLQLESKEHMRALEVIRSPDEWGCGRFGVCRAGSEIARLAGTIRRATSVGTKAAHCWQRRAVANLGWMAS